MCVAKILYSASLLASLPTWHPKLLYFTIFLTFVVDLFISIHFYWLLGETYAAYNSVIIDRWFKCTCHTVDISWILIYPLLRAKPGASPSYVSALGRTHYIAQTESSYTEEFYLVVMFLSCSRSSGNNLSLNVPVQFIFSTTKLRNAAAEITNVVPSTLFCVSAYLTCIPIRPVSLRLTAFQCGNCISK